MTPKSHFGKLLVLTFVLLEVHQSLQRIPVIPGPDDQEKCTSEGYFPNGNDPGQYYRCVKIEVTIAGAQIPTFQKHAFTCSTGTSFDPILNTCNFESGLNLNSTIMLGDNIGLESFRDLGDETTCKYEIEIRYKRGAPDGVTKRMITFNGQFPGPTIRCSLGKILEIKVINRIMDYDENFSIHWHGIEQIGTPFSDGPEYVTQCPIIRGTSMTYRFKLYQAGTYWYHSHHSYQYTDGAWGVLLIANKPEVYHDLYDDELVITLSDWHHPPAKALSAAWLNNGTFPIPNALLINGKGIFNCSLPIPPGTTCTPQRYPVINVIAGKTYRIRVINTATSQTISFAIDEHKLDVIETDGVDTVQVPGIDLVNVWIAQRYSFIVDMNGDGNDYWIRASNGRGLSALAILHYIQKPVGPPEAPVIPAPGAPAGAAPSEPPAQGRPPAPEIDWDAEVAEITGANGSSKWKNLNTDRFISFGAPMGVQTPREPKFDLKRVSFSRPQKLPTTQPPSNPVILDQHLAKPYHSPSAPDYFNEQFTFNATICDENGKLRICFNGKLFQPGGTRSLPVLFQAIKGEKIRPNANSFDVPNLQRVIQIVINNQMGVPHPWHLHGHTFWVVGTGAPDQGNFDPVRDNSKLMTQTVRRDTTGGEASSWVVIRFIANNPGAWLLHCHINWHLQAGLGACMIEGQYYIQHVFGSAIPEYARKTCASVGVHVF